MTAAARAGPTIERSDPSPLAPEQHLAGDVDRLSDFAEETARLRNDAHADLGLGDRLNIEGPGVEQGLPKLVLALIELLRRVLEKQAIRRMEAGALTDAEIERLGDSFVQLHQKLTEMKAAFGLQDEDLNLNLGPLGNLLDDG